MSNIRLLTEFNWWQTLLAFFALLIATKYSYELIEWFIKKLGLETKAMREKREKYELLIATAKKLENLEVKEKEDVKQSIKHDEAIRNTVAEMDEKFSAMMTMLDSLSRDLTEMREETDRDKLAEYKDRIGSAYSYYLRRKDDNGIITWTSMEREAMYGLIHQYEAHGGTNSYVHSIVEPDISRFQVKD